MKFSDVPHFILKAFVERSHEISEYGESGQTDITLINPDFIFSSRSPFEWKDTDGFIGSGIQHNTGFTGAYLIGPRTTISTYEEGTILELYYETSDGLYSPLRMKTDPNGIKHDRFEVIHLYNYNRESDLLEVIDDHHIDENGKFYNVGHEYEAYRFEIYDILNYSETIENGLEVYFRNDSVFCEGLLNYANVFLQNTYDQSFDLRNYVNYDKPFIYFGKIYADRSKTDKDYYIMHYNIKHYVLDCIPEHQRTEKLRDFIYLAFDILYNKIYQTQKDIGNMIDPNECDEYLLSDLGTYYGMDLDMLNFDVLSKRRFLKNLPELLKTKGTYISFYKIGRLLTLSDNRLNIYERGHDENIEGVVPEDRYIDGLHTSFYEATNFTKGAGESGYSVYYPDQFYPRFSNRFLDDITDAPEGGQTNLIEHDLNERNIIVEVYNENNIIYTPSIIYNINPKYIVISPIEGPICLKTANSMSATQINDNTIYHYYLDNLRVFEDEDGNVEYDIILGYDADFKSELFENSMIGSVPHYLDEQHPIVMVFEENGTRIMPNSIESVGVNIIEISFDEEKTGYVLCKVPDQKLLTSPEAVGTGVVLSSSCTIEPDISTEPAENSVILSKDRIDAIYSIGEIFRPINRVNDYKLLISPHTDLSGNGVSLYDRRLLPYFETKSLIGISDFEEDITPGTFFRYITEQNISFQHPLGTTNILIDLYDKHFIRVPREYINYIRIHSPFIIEIDLDRQMDYFVFLKRADNVIEKTSDEVGEGFTHPFNTINILTQCYDSDSEIVSPVNLQLESTDKIKVLTPDVDSIIAYPSDLRYDQDTSNNIGTIDHSLNSDAVLVDVFDKDNRKIYPKNVILVNKNITTLEFKDPVDGYALFKTIGNIGEVLSEPGTLIVTDTAHEIAIDHNFNTSHVMAQIYDKNMNRIFPKTIRKVNDNQLYIELKEHIEFYVFIKAITPADEHSYALEDPAWFITSQTLNFREMNSQFYDGEYYRDPDNIIINSEDTIYAYDGYVDKAVFSNADEIIESDFLSNSGTISHSLSAVGLIIDTYDENGSRIEPTNITILNPSSFRINFDDVYRGHVLISRIGNPGFGGIEDRIINSVLLLSTTQDDLATYEETIPLKRVREEGNYIYAEYIIPKDININIKEMGISDALGNIIYSRCSDLYKRENIEMTVFYRISKTNL